jgi:hypothetical protein
METYKQTLRNRAIFAILYCVAVLGLLITAVVLKIHDTAVIFTLGFGCGILAVVLRFLTKSLSALKDEEKLKDLYIAENDERQKFINAKIGGVGFNVSIMFLSLGMLVSNFFNRTIFLTLLAVVIFMVLVKLILKLYYNQKV